MVNQLLFYQQFRKEWINFSVIIPSTHLFIIYLCNSSFFLKASGNLPDFSILFVKAEKCFSLKMSITNTPNPPNTLKELYKKGFTYVSYCVIREAAKKVIFFCQQSTKRVEEGVRIKNTIFFVFGASLKLLVNAVP